METFLATASPGSASAARSTAARGSMRRHALALFLALCAGTGMEARANPPGALLAAAGDAGQGPSEMVQLVKATAEQLEALRKGTLDTKDRRNLAYTALSRYLSDYLKVISAPEEKVKPFLKGVLKDFGRYVPSYRVEAAEGSEARVTLMISTSLLIAELEKQGLRGTPGGGGANGAEPSKAGQIGGAQAVFPYTALLVDERNREVHVVPPEAVSAYALDNPVQDGSGYRFKPAATLKAVAPAESELNSVSSALATRTAQFSNKILYHLQSKGLVFKPEWTKQILAFLETSAKVSKDRGENRSWPAVLPWTLSALPANPGLVAIFSVRSDDKSGVLERIEIVGNQSGKLLRHYWSRQMHDPAYQESAARALEKAANAFARLHRIKRPEPMPSNLAFWVDKRVPDRDVLAVENILRTFALGEDSLLVPVELTKEDVRYQSPIGGARADKVLDRIRRGVPGVTAKLASGEPPVILLAPQSGTSPAP